MIRGSRTLLLVGSMLAFGSNVEAAEHVKKSDAELKQEASKDKLNRAGCLGSKPQGIKVVAGQVTAHNAQKAVMNDGDSSYSPPKQPARGGCGSDAFYGYAEASSPKDKGRQTPVKNYYSDYPGGH